MNNKCKTLTVILLFFLIGHNNAQPLAFYKGCLVTSITRGPSMAIYKTVSDDNKKSHTEVLRGKIDPLIMEYGITDKFGAGFSLGGENYDVNTNDFYGTKLPVGNEFMFTSTRYLTIDASYHPYVKKKLDVSVFGALGYYNVSGAVFKHDANGCFTGKDLFSYRGNGAVARGGVRARWYYSKRFGLMAMVYAFNGMVMGKADTKQAIVSDGKQMTNYTTTLNGVGLEFGLSFRLFKQKGLKKEEARPLITKVETEDDEEKEPLIRLVWD